MWEILSTLPILLQEVNAHSPEDALSVGWALVIAISFIGALLSVLFVVLNTTIGGIKTEVRLLREELHDFIREQSELNGRFQERMKRKDRDDPE